MNREYRVVTDALGRIIQICDASGNPIDVQEATWLGERMAIAYPSYSSVYLMFDPTTLLYKVGVSKDVHRRRIQIGKHVSLRAEFKCYHFDAYEVERFIHAVFEVQGKRKHGEWFEFNADDLRVFRGHNDLDFFGRLKAYVENHSSEEVQWEGVDMPEPTVELNETALGWIETGVDQYLNPPPEPKPLSLLAARSRPHVAAAPTEGG